MRATSAALKRGLTKNSTMLVKGQLTLADGSIVELTGDDFVSASCESSTSSDGSFDVGAAIIGKADVTLNNYDERFDDYDFEGSSLVLYFGKALEDGTTEWLRMGTYLVDQPSSYSGTISLTMLDYMSKFEVSYADVTQRYPASLQQIVSGVCIHCGVTMLSPVFDNGDYVVSTRPDGSDLTCLDIISYAAQASGNFAKVDERGRLIVDWYPLDTYENEGWLDGQFFDDQSPYASGDVADGGTLDDYDSGYSCDGGDLDVSQNRVHLFSAFDLEVFTDDVVITGVRVTASNEVKSDGSNGNDGETTLFGEEGYVLAISENPLILYGQSYEVASIVGARIVGMRFRPFSGTFTCDPSIESGDPVVVSDRKGNSYFSYVTCVRTGVNDSMSVTCSAESASRNSADRSSALTSAVVKSRNELKREQTAREQAIEELNKQLGDASGLFTTSVKQDDGSYIYYMHDKPELDSSQIVWKYTVEAIGVSLDGGKTYNTGLTATGDAILSRIYTIGLNASYIIAGIIKDKTGENFWNLDTGELQISSYTKVSDSEEAEKELKALIKVNSDSISTEVTNREKAVSGAVTESKSYTDQTAQGLTSSISKSVLDEVGNTYTTKTEFNQNNEQVNIKISSAQATANNALSKAEEVETYFTFDSTGLKVGKTGQASAVKMASDGSFQVLRSSEQMLRLDVHNGYSRIQAPDTGKIAIWTENSSVMYLSSGGYEFHSVQPGFVINKLRAVESYYATPSSSTGSCTVEVAYFTSRLSFVVIYYYCTYTSRYHSEKIPLTAGGASNAVLRSVVPNDSGITECVEVVTLSASSNGREITIARSSAIRIATKTNEVSFNGSPGAQFQIKKLTMCY